MYARLLASGALRRRPPRAPTRCMRRSLGVIQPGIIQLIADADQRFQLGQRERIAFAMLAQTEGLSAGDLTEQLELEQPAALRPWIARLLEVGLVKQTGRTTATRYFVPPRLLKAAGLDKRTTLTRVQPHRLRALTLEDLERYPDSSATEIHHRVGPEVPSRTFRRALESLVGDGRVTAEGATRWRRYRANLSAKERVDGR